MHIKLFSPVEDSLIETTMLSDLPLGLRAMLFPLFELLQTDGIIALEINPGALPLDAATLLRSGGFVRFNTYIEAHKNMRESFCTAFGVLLWYMSKKFVYLGSPGTFGGRSECNSCRTTVTSGTSHCPNRRCPSHTLWKLVDPSYVIPKQPETEKHYWDDMRRMGKVLRRFKRFDVKTVTANDDHTVTVVLRDGRSRTIPAPPGAKKSG